MHDASPPVTDDEPGMSKKNRERKKAMKEQQGCPRPWRQIDDVVVDAHGRIVKAPHGCSWEGDNYNDGAAAARAIVEAVNNSQQSQPEPEGHELYETGDEDAPDSIKDRNGDVALGMCKRCGRAESELSEPCHKAEQPQPEPDVGAMADALGAALRSKHAVFLSRRKLVRLVHAMLKSAPKSCPVKDCEYDR